jgi:hypothetical protein
MCRTLTRRKVCSTGFRPICPALFKPILDSLIRPRAHESLNNCGPSDGSPEGSRRAVPSHPAASINPSWFIYRHSVWPLPGVSKSEFSWRQPVAILDLPSTLFVSLSRKLKGTNMRLEKRHLAAWLCAMFAVTGSHAAETKWVASWASSPLEGKIVIPGIPPDKIPPSPILRGTVRYRLPLSQGGTQLILRITNEANKDPLTLGAVTVGIADAGVAARSATIRKVTFGGHSSVTLPAGTPALSDPLEFSTKSAEAVIVSIFLPNETECPLGQRGIQEVTLDGRDATQLPILERAAPTTARTLVSAILVAGTHDVNTIVAFGDSITDGGITDTRRRAGLARSSGTTPDALARSRRIRRGKRRDWG